LILKFPNRHEVHSGINTELKSNTNSLDLGTISCLPIKNVRAVKVLTLSNFRFKYLIILNCLFWKCSTHELHSVNARERQVV